MAKRNKTGINAWSNGDQPREKLQQKGPSVLSDTELLAILVNSGRPERSALVLAKEILQLAGNNLNQLGRLHIQELQTIAGIGQAKAITIAAAMELGRRRRISKALTRKMVSSHLEAAELLFPLLQDLDHECFCVLYLNPANHLIRHEITSSGGFTATVADIRMILKNALLFGASKIIVGHNHPSGNKNPSREDKRLTGKLREAAALMDIVLVDHIIIAGASYTSFANEGLL